MGSSDIDHNLGISRRDVIKRGAIAGGALVWATPVVQTLGSGVAGAQETPRCDANATAEAIDIATSSTGPDGGDVTFRLFFATSCDPCPPGTNSFAWECREEVNFECDEPTDSDTFGGTLGPGGDGSVVVQATVTVTCEDGDQASDCRAERFEWNDGFVTSGGTVEACE